MEGSALRAEDDNPSGSYIVLDLKRKIKNKRVKTVNVI